jgi:hypothetical protein
MNNSGQAKVIEDKKITHKDRLNKLREVFGRRQEIAKISGKKHDVSIEKICADAKVDKIYLFGHRLKESNPIRSEYLAFKNEVLAFQKQLKAGTQITADRRRADEFEEKYKALLSDIEPLQRELAALKSLSSLSQSNSSLNKVRLTELLARISELESQLANIPRQKNVVGNFPSKTQRHVVSPNLFKTTLGDPKLTSTKREEQAWGHAYKKLVELLSRHLKMHLYILVGMPCSGKTFWAEMAELPNDRHPIIWDDLNLTSIDRYKLVVSLSNFTDLPKSCVYFDTDMELIRERNRKLKIGDNRKSDAELDLLRDKLQKPDPYEETWIESLVVVRDEID